MNTVLTDVWREAGFWLAMLLLAPVIGWQGKQVRRTTPRLPEPPGERLRLPESRSLSVLVVGDSAAAGVGASDQSEALLGQLLSRLSDQVDVGFCLLANTGDTSRDVLAKLEQIPAEHFDWIVVSVGVNDVTGFTSLKRWRQQLLSLRSILQARCQPEHLLFTAVPPMHHFPALPQPLRWLLGWRARQLNRVMQGCLTRQEVLVVDIPFDAQYMAHDGFHPGPLGYACWAEQVIVRTTDPKLHG